MKYKMRGLIIDTETTGLSHNYNQVLTVGMILAEIDDDLNFINLKHIKIKHEKYNVTGIALKINKINLKEHNKIGINSKKACREINDFIIENRIKNIPLIGHNINFDLRFLRELYKKERKEFLLDLQTLDTRSIWINLRNKGIIPLHLRSNLRTLAQHFQVDYNHAHDALQDCKITAQVFHKMNALVKENNN